MIEMTICCKKRIVVSGHAPIGGNPIGGQAIAVTGTMPSTPILPPLSLRATFLPNQSMSPGIVVGRKLAVIRSSLDICPQTHNFKELIGSEYGLCRPPCKRDDCIQTTDRCCVYSRFTFNKLK